MLREQLCHKFFANTSLTMHKTRLSSLLASVDSVLSGSVLSVTQMGRHMVGSAKVKNKIKRTDRLLSNHSIFTERANIYRACREVLLGNPKRLILIADWSPFKHDRDYGLFRISTAVHGRAITLYEEVLAYNCVIQIKTQRRILDESKAILPTKCHVTIVTDMGFAFPWFEYVQSLGWDFVGRVRSDIKYQTIEGDWEKIAYLEEQATQKPRKITNAILFKTHGLRVNLVLKKKSNRKTKSVDSKNPTIKQYQKQGNKPWILATSLDLSAKEITYIYSTRMQIEASFRDCKSYRFGLGLVLSLQKTTSLLRRTALLIIAHIAQCILYLIGFMAENNGWQYDFQANSIKKRRVLSYLFLGKQVLKHYWHNIKQNEISQNTYFLHKFVESPL